MATQSTSPGKAVAGAGPWQPNRPSLAAVCDQDMNVKAISRLAGSGKKDVGPRPADAITPPPVWTAK